MKDIAPCSPFSLAVLREAAEGDDALVAELVTIFLRIVPPMVERLRLALAAANSAAAAQEAHDLKGSLALIGATQASAACAAIETEARRTGRCPAPDAAAALCAQLLDIIAGVDACAASSSTLVRTGT